MLNIRYLHFTIAIFLCVLSVDISAQNLTITTWNLANFGESKDATEIDFMAETIKNTDLLCIQEVSTSPAGAKAVAFLCDALNRKGFQWDYWISDPTMGPGTERYAFLWKKSRIKPYGKAMLFEPLAEKTDREPFIAKFIFETDTFVVATFHAIPKNKNPASEISKLYIIDSAYSNQSIIILGDFNLSASSDAFNSLYKRGFKASLKNQKTSLKMKVNEKGEHLANEYDNILIKSEKLVLFESGVIDFSTKFESLKEARYISDHLPVWVEIKIAN